MVTITVGCRAEARHDGGSGARGQGGSAPALATGSGGSSWSSVAATSGSGGASTRDYALTLSGTVTTIGGTPVAGASVSLLANPAIAVTTNDAGQFLLVSEFATGAPLPPRWPASRPIEHTIVVKSAGFLDAYRGVPGAKAAGELIVMVAGAPSGVTEGVSGAEPVMAEYKGAKLAAVTMTFDDSEPSHLAVARPLFDAYGYKATFYVNSARIGPDQFTTWSMWKDAADAGFEIGNHSRTHWIKPECTPENEAFNWDEMRGGYEDIVAGIGEPPVTFAFPGGGQSPCTEAMVVPSGHIDYRRDDHVVKTDRLYPEGDSLTVESGVDAIDTVIAHTPSWNGAPLSWLLFYMHDVTPEREAVLEAMLDHVAVHDAEVWCAGYGEVTLYEREREQTRFQVLGRGERSLRFRLTSLLDPAIFSVPLTVVVPLPADAGEIHPTAFRDRAAGPVEVRVRQGALQLDVVPGDAPVYVQF